MCRFSVRTSFHGAMLLSSSILPEVNIGLANECDGRAVDGFEQTLHDRREKLVLSESPVLFVTSGGNDQHACNRSRDRSSAQEQAGVRLVPSEKVHVMECACRVANLKR